MPVLFLLSSPTRCPDKREIWLPRATFHVYRGRNVGIQPQNCQNFECWSQFAPQGSLVCTIFTKFSDFIRVHTKLLVFNLVTFGDKQPSYKHFSAVGAFSLKISIAPSGGTIARTKKLEGGGAKMVRSSSITMPSMVRIVG